MRGQKVPPRCNHLHTVTDWHFKQTQMQRWRRCAICQQDMPKQTYRIDADNIDTAYVAPSFRIARDDVWSP